MGEKGRTLLAVDPSINNMGCALFVVSSKRLMSAELLHPEKDAKDFTDKSFSLYLKIKKVIVDHSVDIMVMEMPEKWDTAGFMSRESGAIQKLVFVCGVIYSLRYDIEVKVVTPSKWKGQLPKEVTRNRLTKFYVPSFYKKEEEWKKVNHNIVDAIGIGHWLLYGRV